MTKYLIVGDIHLGKGLSIGKPGIGNALNSRVVDQVKLLDWVIDQAIDNNVESVIITGDICEDPKPDYALIDIFLEFLKRLEIYNINVEIIVGNHDIKRTGSYYRSFLDLITTADISSVYVHKYVNTIIKKDVGFTLLPFRDRRSLKCKTDKEAFSKISSLLTYELECIPNDSDRILIGHLAIEGSIFVGDEIDNQSNELMCPLDTFEGYDYVWMGHVHKPQVCSKDPYIAHVGSLDISDFGEMDHQKIVILYDTESKFKEIKVPSRPLRKIHIDVPEGFSPTSYVINHISAIDKTTPLKNSIVRVDIKLLDEDADNIDRKEIEECIYNLDAYYICNLSESRNISVIAMDDYHDIDNKVDTKAAIKIWAKYEKFDDDDEKNNCINLANKFVDRYDERYN